MISNFLMVSWKLLFFLKFIFLNYVFLKVFSDLRRERIVKKLKSLGFKFVSLDLQGFRSGALNEALSQQEKEGAE